MVPKHKILQILTDLRYLAVYGNNISKFPTSRKKK